MRERAAPFPILVTLAVAAFAGAALAQPPEVMTSFASGPPSGRYAYGSWTPKTLAELAQGTPATPTVNVVGDLALPAGTGRVPAVLLVHGSGGVYKALYEFWAKRLNDAGMAVFTIDMFDPRGVASTAEDQSQVPFAADVADVFGALRLLATHPRIDARRIAVMGFSRGGTAAVRAAAEKVIAGQKLPDGLRFAAHVPVYGGGCAGLFRLVVKPGTFSKSPILFVHGDADDYTPIEPCRDYAGLIGKAGTPVEFVTLEGARHKFDSDDLRRHELRNVGRTRADCPLEVDIDTFHVYDRRNGSRLQGEALREVERSCRTTGATVEGSLRARDAAAEAVVAFLKKTLAP